MNEHDATEFFRKLNESYRRERAVLHDTPSWQTFRTEVYAMQAKVSGTLPHDPRFNAIHWANDVQRLVEEIAFSYALMRAHATLYKESVPVGELPSHAVFHVGYYADNAITRVDSCRDKLALMVWAYFCPFNPDKKEEVLAFESVVERLCHPAKHGLKIANHEEFISGLTKLNGGSFARIISYRHLKIHRREPRVEVYGVQPHHDWPYLVPIERPEEVAEFERRIRQSSVNLDIANLRIEGSRVDGVLYESRRLKNRLWDLDEVDSLIRGCLELLAESAAICFRKLRQLPPNPVP